MQKYEYMKIERDGNGVWIAHSSGKVELNNKATKIFGTHTETFIEVINQYAKEGWRVVAGGGCTPGFVILERPIKE